jgi:hypothetical protein
MPNDQNGMQALVELLRDAEAKPRVTPSRVVRSTLYDLDYHVAVISCVFFEATPEVSRNNRTVVAHWLKILQFVAARPMLAPDFVQWAQTRRRFDLETWRKMPRGFIGDTTHDQTIELLIAAQILLRRGEMISSGERFSTLQSLHGQIVLKDLFLVEREILRTLSGIPVNRTLLSGQ